MSFPPFPAAQTAMTQADASGRRFTIVLLGVTGAGKSTFTSVASNQAVKVGHGADPCTQDPEAVRFKLGDGEVVLIDTPGFDDSMRSDVEILADIATWLDKEGYTKTRPVDGLILLQPATHTVVSGNERKRTRLLEKILGPGAYNRIVIATTMWENLGAEYSTGGFDDGRKNGLWKRFYDNGAIITKHYNTQQSAHRIIKLIISRSPRERASIVQNDKAPLRDELMLQLEEEIDLALKILREHKTSSPPREWKKSKDKNRQAIYTEWKQTRDELEEEVKRLEKKLRKMDKLIVSYHPHHRSTSNPLHFKRAAY